MNINNPTTFATPNLTLGTANSSGTGGALRADDTILVYDTTGPAAVAASAVVGSATTSARRDHVHVGTIAPGTTVDETIARYTGTAGALQAYTSGGPTISDTGIMLKTAQPAFLAINSVGDANVTGAGAEVTVDFDTEAVDQGSNFASDIFTAPVTGVYLLTACVRTTGQTSAANGSELTIVESDRTYRRDTMMEFTNQLSTSFTLTVICDMDANNTARVKFVVSGESSNVVDINGGASTVITYFAGCLLA